MEEGLWKHCPPSLLRPPAVALAKGELPFGMMSCEATFVGPMLRFECGGGKKNFVRIRDNLFDE